MSCKISYFFIENLEEKNFYTIRAVRHQKNSIVEIEAEISAEIFDAHRERTLAALRKEFEMPGFRKGTVPEDIFLRHVHEGEVLEKSAAAALKDALPRILREQKLNILGTPQLVVKKMARGNPLGFAVRVGVMPNIKLPHYKKLARKVIEHRATVDTREVGDKEVEAVMKQIQAFRAQRDGMVKNEPDAALNEFTDEFVKTLGAFKNVEDFKKKVREDIKRKKAIAGKQKLREEIAKAIIAETDISLPDFVIDDETRAAHEHLLETLSTRNTTLQEYLSRSNITEEQMRKEQREYIERQLKMRILLETIAENEKITISEQELEPHIARERMHNPHADPAQLKAYVHRMLVNEKVLELLEKTN